MQNGRLILESADATSARFERLFSTPIWAWLLIALGCLALAVRVWVVLAAASEPTVPPTNEAAAIAENLLAGRGFSLDVLGAEGLTSCQAPFYPMLLATAYRLFGVGTPEALLAIGLLQCAVGTAVVLAVVWLSWSLVPDRPGIGWAAGLIAALYPTHILMVTRLQLALWAALLLTLLLATVVSVRWRATRARAVLAGSLAGLLLLVEPVLWLALPVCGLVFWLSESRVGRSDRFGRLALYRLVLMAGICALIITPWTVRNCLVHGRIVPIKSTLGYAFWQGNNSISWGTATIPPPAAELLRHSQDGKLIDTNRPGGRDTLLVDDLLLGPDDYGELAALSEPERSRLLGARAWRFVRAEPGQYASLCLRRLRYFLLFDETDPVTVDWLARVSSVAWLVLVFVGLLICGDRRRELWPTWAIFAAVALFHSLVIVSPWSRVALEPMTFIWAAWAIGPIAAWHRPIKVYRPGQRARESSGREHALRGPHYRLPRRAGAR